VYVPADDFTDPAAVHTFAHLSASIVLSRKRASEGLYPAVDLLQSTSKMLTPVIAGKKHYQVAQEVRKTLAAYEELKDIIAMLGLEELSEEDRRVVFRARRLERFFTQPFFTTEQFTGLAGKMPLAKVGAAIAFPGEVVGEEFVLLVQALAPPESAIVLGDAVAVRIEARQHRGPGRGANRQHRIGPIELDTLPHHVLAQG